ncbi:MAG: UDP-N-acetylglucosamine 2-epimerase (non-hydrolyzing) [Acidobacteria bacterium]|nr:UDP-N-acetylglucosamine 2-epimerase (non-hydrolyzing) [Acidobacteriota bacterium]MBI3655275.1 UDP-N-acetylglucosamine 2-epimerase (non-hydrolyzing) [Acidobacteriota bacterium]
MRKIVSIVGARPNFMKIAPLMQQARKRRNLNMRLVHTGQHYDFQMSQLFFQELHIPKPDIDLGVGSASHAVQTAEIMKGLEPVLQKERPDLVLVVGDVNSTLAGALTAAKLGIPVAHVEAGLRSFDRTMPEEINRVLTDSLADWLFTSEVGAAKNLLREGVARRKIFFVGNTMIDTLLRHRSKAGRSQVLVRLGLIAENGFHPPRRPAPPAKIKSTRPYALLTLHRPSNVDDPDVLGPILQALHQVSQDAPILFPIHPRTRRQIEIFGYSHYFSTHDRIGEHGLWMVEPLGYLDFACLMAKARLVLTDSGGIQEETTVLGVPCLTLRKNTERPITVTQGTNRVVGTDGNLIVKYSSAALQHGVRRRRLPKYWDGHAAERIIDVLCRALT